MGQGNWIAEGRETDRYFDGEAAPSAAVRVGQERPQHAREDGPTFRLAFSKALRASHDPPTIARCAAHAIAEQLRASGACYGEVSADGKVLMHCGSGCSLGQAGLAEQARSLLPACLAGQPVCVQDVRGAEVGSAEQRAELERQHVRAYVAVPVVSDGRVVALLWAHQDQPRSWTREELTLVQEAAESTWAAMERAHAQVALSSSEEILRMTARRRDEFLALLGHELRNPMASLITSLHLIRKRLPPSHIDHQLDVAERQAGNLARIIDDLLEASRVTEGKLELRREHVDLRQLVRRALDAIADQFEQRRHEVSVSLPPNPVLTFADPLRVEQILTNLLSNAFKYTPDFGHVWVGLTSDGCTSELSVRDDGMGIPPDLLPHLFDLFQQGGRDLSRKQGGLGIGLTIVRKLVDLHGGSVEARSEGPGRGSEFIVRLPLAAEHGLCASRVAAGVQPSTGHPGHHRVLVIDDNADAGEALAELIDDLGHESRRATDGPSGLRLYREWQPEVVFLDIGMPGMDGYEVARELRRMNLANTKLVALTGYGQASDRQRAREAGFDQHLVKPPQIETIENILQGLG